VGIAGVRLKVDPDVAKGLATTVRYGPFKALAEGTRKTWELSVFTVKMLGRVLTGEASVRNISGPITLADYAGQSAQAGALVFVGYLALISISLGVLNLLPVPLWMAVNCCIISLKSCVAVRSRIVPSSSASGSAWPSWLR